MRSVLFVCNGNIFRSMIAEHALRARIVAEHADRVSSAGVTANLQKMQPLVRARLMERGIDPAGHQQRKLTTEILEGADLVVAMGLDHQAHLAGQYRREVPLFNRVCFGIDEPVLDIGERYPDWQEQPDEVDAYIVGMVDTVWEAIPRFLENESRF